MRPEIKAVFVITVIFFLAFAMIPSSAAYPTSFGNKYPATVYSDQGKTGPVTGKVVSSYNKTVGIAGCYVAVVNASNPGQEYANTTSDANGSFQFNGVNATYSSVLLAGPDGTTGTYNAGKSMYKVYVNLSPYGESYSESFGIDSNNSSGYTLTAYLPVKFSSINFSADKFFDTTGGQYSVNLTAYVINDAGDRAADGTMVDFALDILDWSYMNGSLNGNNSNFVSVPTSDGKAVAHYGWFPGNHVPTKDVRITATVHNESSVNGTLILTFQGPAIVITTPTPMPTVTPIGSPVATVTQAPTITPVPSQAPGTTQTPVPTPLSPVIAVLSILAGVTIVSRMRKK
jgi:hypothetical protein